MSLWARAAPLPLVRPGPPAAGLNPSTITHVQRAEVIAQPPNSVTSRRARQQRSPCSGQHVAAPVEHPDNAVLPLA